MSSIGAVLYSRIFESRNKQNNWNKRTIEYAIREKKYLMNVIRSMGIKMHLCSYDIEEIYSNLIEYLLKYEDYDIEKAIRNGNLITLKGYVIFCAKNVTKRYITELYRERSRVVRSTYDNEDGETIDIIDSIEVEDTDIPKAELELSKLIDSVECKRYKYGIDLYMLIYIRIIAINNDKAYNQILEALGIDKKDLASVNERIKRDVDVKNLISAIVISDTEEVIRQLECKVYGHEDIKKGIEATLR